MSTWRNPSEIEMVYDHGPSNWTQSRCRVRSIRGTSVTMVQPCWDNTTRRADAPQSVRVNFTPRRRLFQKQDLLL